MISRARLKRIWRRFRVRLRESAPVRGTLASGLTAYLRFVRATNRVAPGSVDPRAVMTGEPMIIALWHGRHFTVPLYAPREVPVTALVSRSADAELNAAVLERLNVECVRGSGGNGERIKVAEKGGVGAFKALHDALGRGRTVVMIADRKPRAREVQPGLVRLARAANVPIVPVAVSSSRVRRFARAWDGAMLNLPFGRVGIAAGDPIMPDGNDDATRAAVEEALDDATARADALCGLAPSSRPAAGATPENARPEGTRSERVAA